MLYDKEKVKLVIFDCDGVIIDTVEEAFINAYARYLKEYGKKPKIGFKIRAFKARGKAKRTNDFWRTLTAELNQVHGIPENELDETLEQTKKYAKEELAQLRIREGSLETFSQLKENGQEIFLVTIMACTFATVAANNPGLVKAFGDNVITSDDCQPKLAAIEEAVRRLKVSSRQVAAVDDTYGGLLAAYKAGIPQTQLIAYDNNYGFVNWLLNGRKLSKVAPYHRITHMKQIQHNPYTDKMPYGNANPKLWRNTGAYINDDGSKTC